MIINTVQPEKVTIGLGFEDGEEFDRLSREGKKGYMQRHGDSNGEKFGLMTETSKVGTVVGEEIGEAV